MGDYYDHLVDRTAAVLSTARVSRRDRARIMGKPFYQRPAKSHSITVDCAKPEERKVEAGPPPPVDPPAGSKEVDRIIQENALLRAEVQMLSQKIDAITPPKFASGPSIAEVQKAFCEVYNEEGGEAGAGEPYRVDHLKSYRRSRILSAPRQVCMALCRTICARHSLPQIGREFGKKDHTTVMHALSRAAHHLEMDPRLAATHAKVLALFEYKK